MTSQEASREIAVPNQLPAILAVLSTLATNVLDEHINEADECVACGAAWPCERVVLAAHNLGAL